MSAPASPSAAYPPLPRDHPRSTSQAAGQGGGSEWDVGFMSQASYPHRLIQASSVADAIPVAAQSCARAGGGSPHAFSTPADPVVVVTGSLYAVASAMRHLGLRTATAAAVVPASGPGQAFS